MVITTTIFFFIIPVLTSSSSDGNIHLLEEEVTVALRTCSDVRDKSKDDIVKRQPRSSEHVHSEPYVRIDADTKRELNQYNHERRNTSLSNNIHVYNDSNSDHGMQCSALGSTSRNLTNNYENTTRSKRNEPLLRKEDNEQCLSQCVFANLQVVDSRGIPREAELWNKVQTSVTSQQSRILLKDQIRACFQELQTESEDNGCSYSNKLEQCLMLRFSDRKNNGTQNNSSDIKN